MCVVAILFFYNSVCYKCKPTIPTDKDKNKTEHSPVSVKEKKSWCISWLSVVRQEVSIDSLGLGIVGPALGDLGGLVTPAHRHSLVNLFGSLLSLSFIPSLSVVPGI